MIAATNTINTDSQVELKQLDDQLCSGPRRSFGLEAMDTDEPGLKVDHLPCSIVQQITPQRLWHTISSVMRLYRYTGILWYTKDGVRRGVASASHVDPQADYNHPGPKPTFLYSNYNCIQKLYLPLPDKDWGSETSIKHQICAYGKLCC